MRTVLAAIDADSCAEPVLQTAGALADLFDAAPTALHVHGRAGAHSARPVTTMPVHATGGSPVGRIVAAADDPSVVALVLGARAEPSGPRPAGHVALAVMTQVRKPVALVPPEVVPPPRFSRLLVPLDGTHESSLALDDTVRLAHRHQLEVVVLHIHSPDSTPVFSDHEPHAARAWESEFLRRHVMTPHERVSLLRRVGVAASDIATAASDTLADLVVLAWSQRVTGGRGRVVTETLAHTSIPVLLLPIPTPRAADAPARGALASRHRL